MTDRNVTGEPSLSRHQENATDKILAARKKDLRLQFGSRVTLPLFFDYVNDVTPNTVIIGVKADARTV
jgi:hypothetical protein